MAKQPYKTVRMPYGGVGVQISYNDEQLVVPIEHFMAMMLVKGKEISANASGGINLADAVLAVPNWFTDAQRRGILQACEIAQVNCLKVSQNS
jgi:heat shock protein 4